MHLKNMKFTLKEINTKEGERMELSKEQLELIGRAIDLDEVRKLILENISEYNQFIIDLEVYVEEENEDFPRKDDINGCGNLCTI